jgi:hypothetical protein
MLRFCALALATLLLALSAPASAQVSGDSGSGGTPVSFAVSDTSGGVAAPEVDTSASAASADASIRSGDRPPIRVAQEPEPEPEGPGEEQPQQQGPGEEQPDEPGGEPQPPTGDESEDDEPVEVLGDEAPATAGVLPRSGLETLKLGLLGFVFLLVGARLRAVAKRRHAELRRRDRFVAAGDAEAPLAPDGLPRAAPAVSSPHPPADEPAPSGLLPSTATAKRRATSGPPDRSTGDRARLAQGES